MTMPRRLFFYSLVAMSLLGALPTQAQVLNTRPLSEPYINPHNPNAGDIGSRTSPGYRETSPGVIINERRNPAIRPDSCWRDSLGQMHCTRSC
jgi:hypothetical protein